MQKYTFINVCDKIYIYQCIFIMEKSSIEQFETATHILK